MILTVAILIAGSALHAQTDVQFVSQQQRQIKFDSTFNAYFIDNQLNKTSYIEMEANKVLLGNTRIELSADYMLAIDKKESFAMNTQDEYGRFVKLAFWFIDGELEEVSFTDANKVTTSYKDITINTKDISKRKSAADSRL